jgi:hypothetical protein
METLEPCGRPSLREAHVPPAAGREVCRTVSFQGGRQVEDSSQYICLTPTRNEAWILRHFLGAAESWATQIIVADQQSTDETWALLSGAPKVKAVRNESQVLDEAHRQRLLLEHARMLPGRRVLIALDADEALSSNALSSPDWQRIKDAPLGAVIRFKWVNVLPDFKTAWIPTGRIPCGFVDDGSSHAGTRIHSTRIPWRDSAPVLDLDDIVVLHFQYAVWERMLSKQRWYQAWEHVNRPEKGALEIFRHYNHMFGGWDRTEIQPLRAEWLTGLLERGVDYRTLAPEPCTWWDAEVLEMLRAHGAKHFERISIWDKDWAQLGAERKIDADLTDPRSATVRAIHTLLRLTQARRGAFAVRALERCLRFANW